MMSKKSIDEIVADYKGVIGKDFTTRVTKFEEFHKASNQMPLKLERHAQEIVFGNPSNLKEAPGAYNEAYKILDASVKGPTDKLEKVDDIEKMLETYVDKVLEQIHPNYNKAIKEAKEKHGLDGSALRKMKGTLFAQYTPSKDGALNPLSKDFIDQNLKGKTKLEADQVLQNIANITKDSYTNYLHGKIIGDLITIDDHFEFAPYLHKKLDEKGFEHENHPLINQTKENVQIYRTLLSGGDLRKSHQYRLKE